LPRGHHGTAKAQGGRPPADAAQLPTGRQLPAQAVATRTGCGQAKVRRGKLVTTGRPPHRDPPRSSTSRPAGHGEIAIGKRESRQAQVLFQHRRILVQTGLIADCQWRCAAELHNWVHAHQRLATPQGGVGCLRRPRSGPFLRVASMLPRTGSLGLLTSASPDRGILKHPSFRRGRRSGSSLPQQAVTGETVTLEGETHQTRCSSTFGRPAFALLGWTWAHQPSRALSVALGQALQAAAQSRTWPPSRGSTAEARRRGAAWIACRLIATAGRRASSSWRTSSRSFHQELEVDRTPRLRANPAVASAASPAGPTLRALTYKHRGTTCAITWAPLQQQGDLPMPGSHPQHSEPGTQATAQHPIELDEALARRCSGRSPTRVNRLGSAGLMPRPVASACPSAAAAPVACGGHRRRGRLLDQRGSSHHRPGSGLSTWARTALRQLWPDVEGWKGGGAKRCMKNVA